MTTKRGCPKRTASFHFKRIEFRHGGRDVAAQQMKCYFQSTLTECTRILLSVPTVPVC